MCTSETVHDLLLLRHIPYTKLRTGFTQEELDGSLDNEGFRPHGNPEFRFDPIYRSDMCYATTTLAMEFRILAPQAWSRRSRTRPEYSGPCRRRQRCPRGPANSVRLSRG